MSIREIIQNYSAGMAVYDRCHSPTIVSQWQAFWDEVVEFMEQPSYSEVWDILHSAGRFLWKLTGIPLQLLAWPTVCKHSQRFAQQGCIRSLRNCEGNCRLSKTACDSEL